MKSRRKPNNERRELAFWKLHERTVNRILRSWRYTNNRVPADGAQAFFCGTSTQIRRTPTIFTVTVTVSSAVFTGQLGSSPDDEPTGRQIRLLQYNVKYNYTNGNEQFHLLLLQNRSRTLVVPIGKRWMLVLTQKCTTKSTVIDVGVDDGTSKLSDRS
jgi:hypothetical protein